MPVNPDETVEDLRIRLEEAMALADRLDLAIVSAWIAHAVDSVNRLRR